MFKYLKITLACEKNNICFIGQKKKKGKISVSFLHFIFWVIIYIVGNT